MLQVLRQYLPVRKAVLILSETALLTAVLMAGMSSHLWRPDEGTSRLVASQNLATSDALAVCLVSALLIAVLSQVALSFNELYDFRISSSRYSRAARFLTSTGSALAMSLAALLLFRVWDFDRVLEFPGLPLTHQIVNLTLTLVAAFALLFFWRAIYHFCLRKLALNQRLLVLGDGRIARRLVSEMLERPDSGYEIVGMVADSESKVGPGDPRGRRAGDRPQFQSDDLRSHDSRPHIAGNGHTNGNGNAAGNGNGAGAGAPHVTILMEPVTHTEDKEPNVERLNASLYETAKRLKIDGIVVALENRRGVLPTEELLLCRTQGVLIEEAESVFERVTGKIAVEAMRPSYLIFSSGFRQLPTVEAAKRLLDLVLAATVLFFAWPFMILTAIAVRLDSPGPILFRQERVGRYGASFTLLKFRSMREDAEAATGPVWAQENDPRITRVGSFMRKTRLDELPQLFNVFTGTMSMIGPRPERPHFVEDLATKIPYFQQRHIVKPGLTGWAQINYPYGNTIEDALQKLQYDLFYIKYHSLLFDLSILFNTIKTVVLRKGT